MTTWKGKILTIILVVLCSYCAYSKNINSEYISQKDYPVLLADYILEERKAGNLDFDSMKLYNDYNYGSYLLYRGIPVFIDSRADLYSKEFNKDCRIFDDYMTLAAMNGYYEDCFNKYDITHIVTYKKSKLNMLLIRDESYKELYNDKYFVFYERASEAQK